MTSIYIGSTMGYSGKSLVTLGLGLRMRSDGLSVGFIKPFGRVPVVRGGVLTDGDALFMDETLKLGSPLGLVCPVVHSQDLVAKSMKGRGVDMLGKVMSAYRKLSKGKGVMLVGGARDIHDGSSMGISGVALVNSMDARVVMVDPFDGEVSVDLLLEAREVFGERLVGAVVNKTPPDGLDYIKKLVGPYLRRKGIPLLGVLPADKLLHSITVGGLKDALGARVLACEGRLDELVENFLVGAMEVEGALKYFRRTPNKAVVTGGHRSDIQLAALETSTKCLILTGNMPPNDLILTKARLAGVAVLLVKHDTMAAVERIEHALGKARIRESEKVGRARELMEAHFDFGALYAAAGIQ